MGKQKKKRLKEVGSEEQRIRGKGLVRTYSYARNLKIGK